MHLGLCRQRFAARFGNRGGRYHDFGVCEGLLPSRAVGRTAWEFWHFRAIPTLYPMMRRGIRLDIAIHYSYHCVMQVSVADAKNKLPELIKAVEAGEQVTICRRGVPVVDLVRTQAGVREKPKFGTMRERIVVNDPNWWKPMTDEEVDAFLDGRY